MATNLKDLELLDFINKKKNEASTVNTKKVFFIFLKILCNTLYSSYIKLHKQGCSISCSDMIFSIFWIIFNYTYNLKLSMFLCERGVVLFVEYINLSNDMEDADKINMIDVKLFIYKKTLGPLLMENMQQDVQLQSIFNLTNIMRDFVSVIFTTYSMADDINNKLEYVCSQLGLTVYKTYLLNTAFVEKLVRQCQEEFQIKVREDNGSFTGMSAYFYQRIMLLKLQLELGFIQLSESTSTLSPSVLHYLSNLIVSIPEHLIQGDARLVDSLFFSECVQDMELATS